MNSCRFLNSSYEFPSESFQFALSLLLENTFHSYTSWNINLPNVFLYTHSIKKLDKNSKYLYIIQLYSKNLSIYNRIQ